MEKQVKSKKKLNKRIVAILFAVIAIIIVSLSASLFHTNQTGHVQVKQAFYTGEMSVRTSPGTYGQWFGDITDYLYSDAVYLSADNLDGGDEAETNAIDVLFPDGDCDVDFVGQYEVRADNKTWLNIKERYPSQKALKSMIRQQVIEVITNTASLMNAEDAYSSKRSDFIRLAREQLEKGLYKPTYETIYDTIQGGQVQETRVYDVALGKDGFPIIAKKALLKDYGIVFSQFNIKKLHNFDDKTVELINRRKEAKAEQQKAITAKAKGEAEIAKQKAIEETAKIKAVTIAEKDKRVAELNAEKAYEVEKFEAMKANETAKKIEAEGRAKAAANRALVSAGLTPQEQAEWDYKTATGVAKEIFGGKGIDFPEVMVIDGAGKGRGNAVDPFTAVGLESLKNMVNPKATKKK